MSQKLNVGHKNELKTARRMSRGGLRGDEWELEEVEWYRWLKNKTEISWSVFPVCQLGGERRLLSSGFGSASSPSSIRKTSVTHNTCIRDENVCICARDVAINHRQVHQNTAVMTHTQTTVFHCACVLREPRETAYEQGCSQTKFFTRSKNPNP